MPEKPGKGFFFCRGAKMKGKEELKIVLNTDIEHWRVDQQPDKELTTSMKEKGQLQNIIARRLPNGALEVIGGTRRFKSLLALGKKP
jgi:ParB-like chromosome segregation protein Spo0J